jgi:3-phosphoshikimate 1-carboxyvinyltransferase
MTHNEAPTPGTSEKANALKGQVQVPGDKSISHRSLMLASQAIGTSRITGLLEGEDVLRTAEALCNLGVTIERNADGVWSVEGVGVGGFAEPEHIFDMGNAGTGTRLMMGLLAPYPFTCLFTGDASLRKRPMKRVTAPLSQMGAEFWSRSNNRLPLAMKGSDQLLPIEYTLPVASAQVKSAILLAGLNTAGNTSVIEPVATRDHTERMLISMGADITTEEIHPGRKITIHGFPELNAQDIDVPGDPSSAAFLVVAALIVPGSSITIENVCMNRLRTGLFDTLIEMGADITYRNERVVAGEEIADMVVNYSELAGIEVPAARAPSMIDEYPILSIAAACAKGTTVMHGLEELRVKESDRLAVVEAGLNANGVECSTTEDSLAVIGGTVAGGGMVMTHLDHRIAMSFLVLGLVAEAPVSVDDASVMDTSFPNFSKLMNGLGAKIT